MATPYAKSGGVWSPWQAAYAKSGGVWHAVQEAYEKVGGVWTTIYSASSVVPGNFPMTLTVTDFGGSGVNGPRIRFFSDGSTIGDSTGSGSPSITDSWGNLNWFAPTTSGAGNSYWLRLVPTSGSFSTNGASGWTSMASTITATITQSAGGGTQTCVFTVQIATDSGGSNIVLNVPNNSITSDR